MPNTPIQSFYLNGWKGGWQPDLEQSALTPDAVPSLENMTWTDSHGLEKRKGVVADGTNGGSQEYPTQMTADEVYTSSGLHPNFTQQVHSWDESDGRLWVRGRDRLLCFDLRPRSAPVTPDATPAPAGAR